MLRSCSRAVFSCFKAVERAGDRITGAVGPLFVGLAWILMTTGVVYFFNIVAPTLPWPIISVPLCILCGFNMLFHYYHAWRVPPGSPEDGRGRGEQTGWFWANRRGPSRRAGVTWSEYQDLGQEWVVVADQKRPRCKKGSCSKAKPERTHHCRVCRQCVLKYDHHCPSRIHLSPERDFPGINQCVGLRNERHFVLFMTWFVISTAFFVMLGYDTVWMALDFRPRQWTSALPQTGFILVYILCLALGFAVSIMLSWHLYLISHGESTVENYDFARYRDMCKHRGTEFVNSYDLGRIQNLALFFNVVPSGYPLYTLVLPLRCAPYSDGVLWARRPGFTRHGGIDDADELTDVDEDA